MNTTGANKQIYFNTSSCGLVSPESLQNIYALYEQMQTAASIAVEDLRDNGISRIRQKVASFINAPMDNIAFIPNFSYGLNAFVQSLKGSEKVLLYKQDYPSVIEPFRVNHFDITWIEARDGFTIDKDELQSKLLDNKIDLLVMSHVQWLSGYTLDIAAIGDFCAANNILFIVDATQSAGAIPIDIDRLKVDALLWSNYKWMNAGFGTGVMYISDKLLQRYEPVMAGSNSYIMQDGKQVYRPSAKSYEPGHLNFHGLLVMEAAIDEKLQIGVDAIYEHNMKLTAKLLRGIKDAGGQVLGDWDLESRCSITLLKAEEGLHKYLWDKGIISIQRGEYIRLGLHYYNTEEEVARVTGYLKNFYEKK